MGQLCITAMQTDSISENVIKICHSAPAVHLQNASHNNNNDFNNNNNNNNNNICLNQQKKLITLLKAIEHF